MDKELKVLVVDDALVVLKSLKKELTQRGMEVVTASDGKNALEKLKEFTPDIILVDIIMPNMDGIEFLEIIRSKKEYDSIPVVMLTNIDQKSIIDDAKAKGANDYFIKLDYSPEEIFDKINELLNIDTAIHNKVLIVDDAVVILNKLGKQLTDKGMEVATASDGEKALEKLKEFTPDIILLDIVMPNMDGIEFLEVIRSKKEYDSIPVVMLTNIDQQSIIDDVKAKGANDFFVKMNYSPKEIFEKIEKFLNLEK